MRLLPERLDDRSFEQLFEEARALIPRFAPNWTDHNTHDPGISLLELWAWLTEGQFFRLERVTPGDRESFLEMLGTRRREARPARVVLLPEGGASTASQFLPGGTRVVVRGARDLGFETEHDVWLTPARIQRIVAIAEGEVNDVTAIDRESEATYYPFGLAAAEGSILLLSVDAGSTPQRPDSSPRRTRLELTALVAEPQDTGPTTEEEPECPPVPPVVLAWEYRVGQQPWQEAELLDDETRSLTRSGLIVLTVPTGVTLELRVRIASGTYDWAPSLRRLSLNGVAARQVEPLELSPPIVTRRKVPLDDLIRQAGGIAPQSADLAPVHQLVSGEEGRLLELRSRVPGGWAEWSEVASLAGSAAADRHYVFDREARELRFGDGINGLLPFREQQKEEDGTSRTERVSDIDTVNLTVTRGSSGNVEAGQKWDFPDNGISGIRWVNPESARGGADHESFDDAEDRTRRNLLSVQRAVTADDFEELALRAPGVRVARALALFDAHPAFPGVPLSGHVTVVVVAQRRDGLPPNPESQAFLDTVAAYLERHRLLGDEVHVVSPEYVEIGVRCMLHIREGYDGERLRELAREELNRRLASIGPPGTERTGWPFGKDIQPSQITAWLDDLEGVEYVDGLELTTDGTITEAAELGAGALPVTGSHAIEIAYVEVPRSTPTGPEGGSCA